MCELFVRRLAGMILSGELRVGERLPPERQLAEQMGVSKAESAAGLLSGIDKTGRLTFA